LKEKGIIPRVVVCGGGAAGVELAFAFKARWSREFGQDIEVSLISDSTDVLPSEKEAVRNEVRRKLEEKGIALVTEGRIQKITASAVHLIDGRVLECNTSIWATGAEPQQVNGESDLDTMNGYFKVNDYLQSTSHPNIFAGGDCITMESYAEKSFPPKAGVYAVRSGPIVA
jgi:selenide, water dikinase